MLGFVQSYSLCLVNIIRLIKVRYVPLVSNREYER